MMPDEITNREFDNWANVQHMTHCWGGHTEKIPVPIEQERILRELNLDWLNTFLRMSKPHTTAWQYLLKGKDNRHQELPGSEFTVGAYFIIPERLDELMKRHTAIVVTTIDGNPAHSSPDYDALRVGKGMFTGYKLVPGKTRYTLRYSTAEQGGIPQHVEFRSDKPTIIGSHLFLLDDMRKRNSLHNVKPVRTSILIHQS